jgi:DNA-binding MarR family transcriptional regulator
MLKEKAEKLAFLAPKVMGAFHDMGRRNPDNTPLTMRQYQALIILNANDHLTLSELCDKLNLAASTGTELVNRMIAIGFLQKVTESKDRRQVVIKVTDKGRKLLDRRHRALSDIFTRFMTPFSDKDREDFVGAFDLIWQVTRKYYRNGDSHGTKNTD